jgi:hypothetical protein
VSEPGTGSGPAAYLATVISRGATQLANLTDGRKRALSALAYHAGGLLAWSGLDREHVTGQLIDAGITAGLSPGGSARIVDRALANGLAQPVTPPSAPAALARQHDQPICGGGPSTHDQASHQDRPHLIRRHNPS